MYLKIYIYFFKNGLTWAETHRRNGRVLKLYKHKKKVLKLL